MAVECYAIVLITTSSKPGSEFLKERERRSTEMTGTRLPKTARYLKSAERGVERTDEYHLCHTRLVQPVPKPNPNKLLPKDPVPKWEIVHELFTVPTEQVDCFQHVCLSGNEQDPFDPFGDAYRQDEFGDLYRHQPSCPLLKGHLVCTRDYDAEWKASRYPEYNRILVTFDPALKYLPISHVVEENGRVQLCEIRYLYPECRKMPMNVALDYVRDRM